MKNGHHTKGNTLGPSIWGTKCDRDKLIFPAKRGVRVNQIMIRHTIGTQSDKKTQKQWSSPQKLPTVPKYGSTHPRCSGEADECKPSLNDTLIRVTNVCQVAMTLWSDGRMCVKLSWPSGQMKRMCVKLPWPSGQMDEWVFQVAMTLWSDGWMSVKLPWPSGQMDKWVSSCHDPLVRWTNVWRTLVKCP